MRQLRPTEVLEIKRALDAYVRACGGDPNASGADVVLAEREVDDAVARYESERAKRNRNLLSQMGIDA